MVFINVGYKGSVLIYCIVIEGVNVGILVIFFKLKFFVKKV